MPALPPSSRSQYQQYRKQVRQRKDKPATTTRRAGEIEMSRGKSTLRHRSFMSLFASFWGILRGHHHMVALTLLTLSISTFLGLVQIGRASWWARV